MPCSSHWSGSGISSCNGGRIFGAEKNIRQLNLHDRE